MKKLVGGAVLILIVGVAAVQFGALSILGGSDCSWAVVEIDGQTYDSLDAFKQAVEQHGTSFDRFRSAFDFRMRNGQLEAKSTECGVEEAPGAASAADVVPAGGGATQ